MLPLDLPQPDFSAVANPIAAAAQSVGVKPGDLPDLTIKEVKVYVTDISNIHKLNSPETGELLSIVTNSGIEGNYTIGDRNATPGWLEWAKPALVGKNIMDLLPTLTSTSGMKGPGGYDGAPTRGAGRRGGGWGSGGGAGGEEGLLRGAGFRGLGRRRRTRARTLRLRGRRFKGRGCRPAAAARGRITTRQQPMSACGTFWARRLTGRFTRSFPEACRRRTG